jgi:hypothetical protein
MFWFSSSALSIAKSEQFSLSDFIRKGLIYRLKRKPKSRVFFEKGYSLGLCVRSLQAASGALGAVALRVPVQSTDTGIAWAVCSSLSPPAAQ